MTERLILDYRAGGSSQVELGERIDDEVARATLDRARERLVARGNEAALRLFDAFDFGIYDGRNGFGDAFIVVSAEASAERLADHRARLRMLDGTLKRAAADMRAAFTSAYEGDEEVRFLVLSLADNILHGERGEYIVDSTEYDRGGFASIFKARTASGELVALKRLYVRDGEAEARMRREIQEQRRIEHAAVMPILDCDAGYRWFIMPFADENLAARFAAGTIEMPLLITILRSAAEGLAAAHGLGLVHRDVTPRNILRLGARWVVADWGVVRRPRGMTTMLRTHGELGTNGFAAPELFREAHDASPAADVYSLGRIVAWAVTRQWPEQNIALYPEGPWRFFVRRTTEHDPKRRPQSMTEVLQLLNEVERDAHREMKPMGLSPRELADRLPNAAAAEALLELALEQTETADVFLDYLGNVRGTTLAGWIAERPADIDRLASAMQRHLLDNDAWGRRGFDASNTPIAWLRHVADGAADAAAYGLLEDVSLALFEVDARWRRFRQRTANQSWLASLRGDAARAVARSLNRVPAEVRWLVEDGWSPHDLDSTLRSVFDA